MTLRLSSHILRVKNIDQLVDFYVKNFGMEAKKMSTSSSSITLLGYRTNFDEDFHPVSSSMPRATLLELHEEKGQSTNVSLANSGSSKVYWKIGITLHDVDLARERLLSRRIAVSEASQFEDIGYLCHLNDPNGFGIELLQHDFQQNFHPRNTSKNEWPLGSPACLGQITIQSSDIDRTRQFYSDFLAMKLLSIQDVSQYGFTLYFFAWTDENPPRDDLRDATVNREWLWKRPYTTIEVRHFNGQRSIPPFRHLNENEIGFQGIRLTTEHLNEFIDKVKAQQIPFEEKNSEVFGREILIRDPDQIPIFVSQDIV